MIGQARVSAVLLMSPVLVGVRVLCDLLMKCFTFVVGMTKPFSSQFVIPGLHCIKSNVRKRISGLRF